MEIRSVASTGFWSGGIKFTSRPRTVKESDFEPAKWAEIQRDLKHGRLVEGAAPSSLESQFAALSADEQAATLKKLTDLVKTKRSS